MKYDIRKNWLSAFEMITRHPVVILPFIFIAFFEALALELVYFSTRNPIALIADPIIRKFFGEAFVHYPGSLVILPRLFYYAQVCVYVLIGVFLTGVSVNIFKNMKEGLPIKIKALMKNALKNYASFFAYGILMVTLLVITERGASFIFVKFTHLVSRHFPQIPLLFYRITFLGGFFLTNVMLQALFVLTIPIIVLEKRPFFKAVFASVALAVRNFFNIFGLIFLPFLAYLPLSLLKSDTSRLIDKTFPEMAAVVTLIGIIVSIFADSFMIVCVTQFLIGRNKK